MNKDGGGIVGVSGLVWCWDLCGFDVLCVEGGEHLCSYNPPLYFLIQLYI